MFPHTLSNPICELLTSTTGLQNILKSKNLKATLRQAVERPSSVSSSGCDRSIHTVNFQMISEASAPSPGAGLQVRDIKYHHTTHCVSKNHSLPVSPIKMCLRFPIDSTFQRPTSNTNEELNFNNSELLFHIAN